MKKNNTKQYNSYIDNSVGPWSLPASVINQNDAVGFHIIKTEWEGRQKKAIFEHVTKFDIALQAGGWLGVLPRLLSDYFETVYTFEPDFESFKHLIANTASCDNVIPFNAALSTIPGQLAFERTEELGQSRVASDDAWPDAKVTDVLSVQALNIDCLNLPGLDFLMIDTEGHLPEILVGAKDTIQEYHPVIIAETHWKNSIKDFEISYLQSLGYNVIIDLTDYTPQWKNAARGDYLFKME